MVGNWAGPSHQFLLAYLAFLLIEELILLLTKFYNICNKLFIFIDIVNKYLKIKPSLTPCASRCWHG